MEELIKMLFMAKKRQDYDRHWADNVIGSGEAQNLGFHPAQDPGLDYAAMPESPNVDDRRGKTFYETADPSQHDWYEQHRMDEAARNAQFRLTGRGRYLQDGKDEDGFYGGTD